MALLDEFFQKGAPDLAALQARLDALGHPERLLAIRGLSRRQQAALFEAAAGFRPIDLDHLVPAHLPALAEVPHLGKNSLPAFTHFAKVFCKPDEESGVLWGYNRTRPLIATTVGPGYFVVRPHEKGQVLVDYLEVPPRKPAEWPPILPNSARLSRVVYHQTQDLLRGVSAHVSIGRATRKGKAMDAWFVLCKIGD